jgi:hypothetical protein
MMLRVGGAAVNADPLPATPRRPLSEVAQWSSDDTLATPATQAG